MSKPILLHLPHSSTEIPPDVRPTYLISPEEVEEELLKLTDRYTHELFELEGLEQLIFPVSRIVIDPERFDDDAQEVMAERGMGVFYTKTAEGKDLRTSELRSELLTRYYVPHHKALTDWVDRSLAAHGKCLIVDCHSYPEVALPNALDLSDDRPSFCIGTDSFHTPKPLCDLLESLLADFHEDITWMGSNKPTHGVTVDRPYSGSIVPMKHYGKDQRVASIMIEVNRVLYMDEVTGDRLPFFPKVKERMGKLLAQLAADW